MVEEECIQLQIHSLHGALWLQSQFRSSFLTFSLAEEAHGQREKNDRLYERFSLLLECPTCVFTNLASAFRLHQEFEINLTHYVVIVSISVWSRSVSSHDPGTTCLTLSLEVTTGQDLEGFPSHLSVNENTASPLLCRRNFCGPRTEADLAARLALESAHCLQVLK